MMLHLVTDRKRLVPDGDEAEREAALVAQVAQAVAAGIHVIQIREPDLPSGSLARLTRAVVRAASGSSTRVLVNDRLDVALVAGADGVHLKGHSFDALDVRRLLPQGSLVGRSVHSVEEARMAGPVDYLIAGAVWPTRSKPADHVLLGLEGLRHIAATTSTPVIAIGGITPENAGDVARAGAAGVAAIGAFMVGRGQPEKAASLSDIVRAFRRAFGPVNMNG